MINAPGVLPTAFRIGGVVFAHSLPVQAVPGDFFRQNALSPSLVYVRIKQGNWINAEAIHPPVIDLHLADIKRFPCCDGLTDQPLGLFPRGRIVGFPGHIDGQRIQPGFLPGNGLDQGGRRLLGLGSAEGQETKCQNYGWGQGNHAFHGVKPLGFSVERSE